MAAIKSVASSPLQLPCGLVLKNRLVKSAMSEKMAIGLQPTSIHERVYKCWAQGGWAALVTGMALFVHSNHLPELIFVLNRKHHG